MQKSQGRGQRHWLASPDFLGTDDPCFCLFPSQTWGNLGNHWPWSSTNSLGFRSPEHDGGGTVEDPFRTIEWKGDHIRLLDQTLLPGREEYVAIRNVDQMCDAIQRLVVRGAPAIGVAAAMGIALGALNASETNREAFNSEFDEVCSRIAATRPTAVNLFWAVNRMRKLSQARADIDLTQLKQLLIREAVAMEKEDRALCERIGAMGKDLIEDGDTVLTHCNAGGLATAGYGTALGVIRAAFEAGKRISVVSDETRPLNQGARITSWELMKLGIPVTLIPDNTAGALMQRGRIQKVIVGADRIAADGDAANKIGTYSVAVLAKYHGIPFYVAAPLSTIDMSIPSGDGIPIEERDPKEVTHISGVRIAPDGVDALNIAFDVTPHKLIAGIVTEWGVASDPFEETFAKYFLRKSEETAS
ncbi:MAG: S-methyl-5-thioribose-1-phosphate isomerase [Desulfomonile tiedjei]|uniref:Methylthioribose-1-phosphate isomerase n=1 Tax=Desulfomonile tiedjei TaxID=2358 RepID=A0A9D6UXS5_9BACT|nr:S-methyl-5-thioribose-1-phosphate isomerase [Desulfomonile tiedjei]